MSTKDKLEELKAAMYAAVSEDAGYAAIDAYFAIIDAYDAVIDTTDTANSSWDADIDDVIAFINQVREIK